VVELKRLTEVYGATVGRWIIPGVDQPLWTLERPWLNNKPRISCIPKGEYRCQPHGWKAYTKFREVWEVTRVPGRIGIILHPLNTVDETEGCVGIGMGLMVDAGSVRLIRSRDAFDLLRKTIGEKAFDLTVD
jgi:hypothetical protein